MEPKDFVELIIAGHRMLERFSMRLCSCGLNGDADPEAHAGHCAYRETIGRS